MLIYNTETRFYKTIQAYGDVQDKIKHYLCTEVKPYPLFKQVKKRFFNNGFKDKQSCSIAHVTNEAEQQLMSYVKILARENEIYVNGERVTS